MRNKRVCDYIAEAIQNEILSGRMSSGVPLRQEELADSLGYSRIPIREALQILESQGLAKRLATRHVVVADFSDEVITEIYELLSDVEIKLLKGMLQLVYVCGIKRSVITVSSPIAYMSHLL